MIDFVYIGVIIVTAIICGFLNRKLYQPIKLRDDNDYLHLYGSMGLSFAIAFISAFWINGFVAWLIGMCATNFLGFVYELLEWKVLKDYRDPYFNNKPWWFAKMFSGDGKFDKIDLKLNWLGSTLIFGIIDLVSRLFPVKEKE